MKKLILLALCLSFYFSMKADTQSANVITPGTLATVASAYLATVTNLTVIGTIDATDFKTMRDNMPLLAVVDMSGATLAAYTGTGGTKGTSSITYPANEIPQYAFCNPSTYNGKISLTSVVLPSSLTSIGAYAFDGCRGLTAITIPFSLTSIGASAFDGCSGLTAITIPSSVTTIGNYAFYGCSGLTTIMIPDLVTSIGTNAFNGCSSLTTITIPASVTSIGDYTFSRCTGLTTITIPASVTSIGDYTFSRCTGLTAISLPSSVTSIGDYAFQGCTGLTAISLNASVTSIGYYAFQGNIRLTTISLPASVTFIGSSAFQDCTSLTTITILASVTSIGSSTFQSCTGLTSITLPFSLTSIGDKAFQSCTSLTSIAIPASVTSIGSDAFLNCIGLTAITIPASVTFIGNRVFKGSRMSVTVDANNPNYSSIDGVLFNKDQFRLIYFPITKTGSYIIPTSVFIIENQAFSDCSGLTDIIMPDDLSSIGSSAFYGCSGLTAITIPTNETSISSGVFENCSALISITINAKLTYIGTNAFLDCISLTSITLPASVTSINSYAFKGCSALTTITLPFLLTSIGNEAFNGCTKLGTINAYMAMPVSLTERRPVFESVPTSTCVLHLTVGSKAAYQSAEQWSAFTNITEDLVLPTLTTQAVSNIGATTATGNANITELGLPNPTQYGMVWSTDPNPMVVLYAHKTTQGANAVSGAFTSTITGLAANAKYYVRPYITNSTGTYYGTEVSFTTLPPTIESTAGGLSAAIHAAGYSQVYLIGITITGTLDARDFKTMRDEMPQLAVLDMSGATIAAYCGYDGTLYTGNYTNITYPANEIPKYAFYNSRKTVGKTSLTSVVMPTSIISIEDYAFYDCKNLSAITIPASVTSIGSYAFYNCSGLTAITIPASVTSIGSCAFQSCNSLTAITIPASVTSIGFNVFSYTKISVTVNANNPSYSSIDGVLFNKSQTSIIYVPQTKTGSYTIPVTVTSIGDGAFYVCSSLTAITIPASVTSIGYSAFYNCSALTSITIPAGVTTIRDYTFYNCSGLSTINIPALVTNIESYAFDGCSGLTAITIPASVTTIRSYAFSGCSQLRALYSYSNTPVSLAISASVFESVPTSTCILHVLEGTKIKYQAAVQWKDFANITEDLVIPTLTTQDISNISFTTATGNANITNLGTDNPTQYGVVWSTATNPTVVLATKTTQGAIDVTGAFTSTISGLTANTKYYVRPYVTNSTGTYYGTEVTFITVTPIVASTAGGLSAAIIAAGYALNTLSVLTITGTINAQDFKTMRDDMPLLAILDISGTTIVAYTGTAGTAGIGNITYPVNEIPEFAFCNSSTYIGKTSLTSVVMPTSVTSIGGLAFYGNSSLTAIAIPASVTTIGKYAYQGCSGLTAITIPASVTSIGSSAFTDSKMSVTIDANNLTYSSIDGVLFDKLQTTLIYFPQTKTGSYTIPVTITSIGNYAFYGCIGLTDITISTSVTSIGISAFYDCSGLTAITLAASVTSIASYAFQSCTKLAAVNTYSATPVSLTASTSVFGSVPISTCVLHIPVGAKAAYMGAEQWNDFTNITEDLVIPTLTTQDVSNIGTTTATGNANITDLGTDNPIQYGVVWSTATNPTVALVSKTTQGAIAATGAFTSTISGLTANTKYYIRPYATNSTGTYYGTEVTFTSLTTNNSPTDMALSANSINENVAANSTVGALSSTDPDANNTFTYTFVAGTGSTDNTSFNISGSFLQITTSPNFEAKSSYSVRVRTTDQDDIWFEKTFTITINNVNEVPNYMALSANSINENVAVNSTVGILSSTDPDAGNTFTYTLVTGLGSSDNASFNISGSILRISASPNFEAKSNYSVRIRTTDQGGLWFEKTFIITIKNVNEVPTYIVSDRKPIFF